MSAIARMRPTGAINGNGTASMNGNGKNSEQT